MPDTNGPVEVPRWQIHLLGGLIVIMVAAYVARGVATEKSVADLRERMVKVETIQAIEHPDRDGA